MCICWYIWLIISTMHGMKNIRFNVTIRWLKPTNAQTFIKIYYISSNTCYMSTISNCSMHGYGSLKIIFTIWRHSLATTFTELDSPRSTWSLECMQLAPVNTAPLWLWTKNETFFNFEHIIGTCTCVMDINAWLCGLAEEDM